MPKKDPITTQAIGEEEPVFTTQALGEEDTYTTDAIGEEDPIYTTMAMGEEDGGDPYTSGAFGAY